jgi:hypothetical protein
MYPHKFAAKAMTEAMAEREKEKRQAQVDSGPKEHGPERPKYTRGVRDDDHVNDQSRAFDLLYVLANELPT